MKVKSLFAASLAAMTLFSCSNEVEELNSGAGLAPGDALISIDLGGGKTTYSTIAAEERIKNGSAKLFKKNGGAEIALTDLKIEGNKFIAKVLADAFSPGDEASLYLYVNATPNAQTTETDFSNVKANTELDYELSKGLPASGIKEIILNAGAITAPSSNLKRVASRIGAIPADGSNLIDLQGYKIQISNHTANGYLFPKDGQDAISVETTSLTKVLSGDATDMYKGSETINYIYPSKDVKVVVTTPDGTEERETTFTSEAGKNYTLKIKPMLKEDASFDWDITIDEWDTVGGVEVDFTQPGTEGDNEPKPENPKTALDSVLIEIGGNSWMPFNTSGDFDTDNATARAILKAGNEGDNILNKLLAYAAQTKETYQNAAGTFFHHQKIKCPIGYRVAKLVDYAALGGVEALPLGASGVKWNETTKFPNNNALTKASFTYPTGVNTSLDFIWVFADLHIGEGKSTTYLPFLGAHVDLAGTPATNIISAAVGNGMGIWTQEYRGEYRERVSPWNDGWANNATAFTSSWRAYVRCIKE